MRIRPWNFKLHDSDPVRIENAFSDYIACVRCFSLLSKANVKR